MENGHASTGANSGGKSKLTLTFERATFALHVDGEIVNVDEALAMLAQATRHFEDQRRILLASQLHQQQMENARVMQIRQSLSRGN